MLPNCPIAICGGDKRELIVIESLVKQGADILICGFEAAGEKISGEYIPWPDILKESDIIIGSLSGIDSQGLLYSPLSREQLVLTPHALKFLSSEKVFITGRVTPYWQDRIKASGAALINSTKDQELSILNAIPTAEGVIQTAMEMLPVTLHGIQALVLGYGRCGKPIARMLLGLGVKVTVAARREDVLAEAYAAGCFVMPIEGLKAVDPDVRLIVNTIPSLVLTGEIIKGLPTKAVIIDIASSPGGTDFNTAEEMGITARLVLGIPGKRAPETAGEILAKVYPRIIRDAWLQRRGEN